MTNGKAVPSFRPASPVRAKRSRSRSAGVAHLHVGGQHRVGRRQDRAEQDRRPQRQAEPDDADQRDAAPTVSTIDTEASRSGQPPAAVAQAATRSFSPAVNSETMTATSVTRSSSGACATGSSRSSPRPSGPSPTPTTR